MTAPPRETGNTPSLAGDTAAHVAASRAAGAAAAAVGLLVLLGWATGNGTLKSVSPDAISMKPNTALAFVLLGIAFLLPRGGGRGTAGARTAAALAAALLGAAILFQWVADVDLGIDEPLFRDDPGAVRTLVPGRMAPAAAACFVLLGACAPLLGRAGLHRVPSVGAILVCLLALASLLGYAYDVTSLQGAATLTPMAIHTAATFGVLGVGLLLAWPDRGIVGLLRRRTAGGLLLRRWLPAALLLPVLLGWLRREGERAGLYEGAYGTVLFATVFVAALSGLVLWTAASLDRAEEATRRAEEERDRFFTQSMDLLCVAGTDGYFKRLNPAWERALGHPIAELLSRPYVEFVHPEDRGRTAAEAAVIEGGTNTFHFENRYRHADGTYRWLSWVSRAPEPGQDLIYATARDVTAARAAAEEIRGLHRDLEIRMEEVAAANRELEAFSYSVSHDLRAPLRAVEGFGKALLEESGPRLDGEGRRQIGIVLRNAARMGRLIDDLLAFSRAGRAAPVPRPIESEALVREVWEEARRGEPDRAVELRLCSLPPAHGDPSLVRQVFANLLGNALKFTRGRAPAVIEVSGSAGEEGVRFVVRDNGAGFDPGRADGLFVPFRRLHAAEEFEGTGIGLALVQRIVHRHGGRVGGDGKSGEGAAFWFTLPGSPG